MTRAINMYIVRIVRNCSKVLFTLDQCNQSILLWICTQDTTFIGNATVREPCPSPCSARLASKLLKLNHQSKR